ncbi:MAG: M20/M25/M40 family metallo-hydrolase [Anaerolineae bacterium]|nr:M20/M25/M40 family metallo-hydrolase [Anaerolineae bacterium]
MHFCEGETLSREVSSKSTIELIKRLSLAIGVTGYSGPNAIHPVIVDEMTSLVDRVEQDRMGSIIGVKEGQQRIAGEASRRKIMLAAHLDEIGAMVTNVDRGFLRFTQVGALDARVLMGQEVMVHARRDLPGVIASVPPHLLPPNQPADSVDQTEMYLDVGLPPRQVEKLVQVGNLVSFVSPPVELLNGLLSGKAMDNRASVAAMLLCLRELGKLQHQWDVYTVATADEEWGGYVGATTQAYAIHPDLAIVMDVTFADVEENEIKLGNGPVITVGPNNHPAVCQCLVEICRELELKYQQEAVSGGPGTDAYAVEVSREGVPTVLISVPSRNMHSPVEIVHPRDIERIARLLAVFITGLNEDFIEKLVPAWHYQ